MKASLGFGERVDEYVEHTADAMKRTPRWADTTYPIAISDMIKSASKVDIINNGNPWDIFSELSDISWVSTHTILKREWNVFIIQDTRNSIREILMQRDDDGRLVVWYKGEIYNEFDRSWNVYSHSDLLAKDIATYGKISVDQWLMTEEEVRYDIWRAFTHDALSETEISDMESTRKTPAWRAYEEETEQHMIAKHFPHDEIFLTKLLQYGKQSPFKTADRLQAVLDVFHMMCHPDTEKRNYANDVGASYEVALNGLSRLTNPETMVKFSNTSRNILEVRGLLQQIKQQWVSYFPLFLEKLKEQKESIVQQVRHADDVKREMDQIAGWINTIEKNMNIINDATAKI